MVRQPSIYSPLINAQQKASKKLKLALPKICYCIKRPLSFFSPNKVNMAKPLQLQLIGRQHKMQ